MTEPTDAEIVALIEKHLGLKPRRDDTVIDPRTGRFHDVQRYRDFARAVLAHWGQPQAGAVPLTCEWAHNENDGFWESACGEAWRFDDGGPGENNMHFCHSCGNSLRIKGGQHGTE